MNPNGTTAQTYLNRAPNHFIGNTAINRTFESSLNHDEGIQTELRSILREIRVITNKIRAEVFNDI